MVLAYSFLVRSFKNAVRLPLSVVVELHLAHAELVVLTIFRVLANLLNGFTRQRQVVVVIHERWHWRPLPSVTVCKAQCPGCSSRTYLAATPAPERTATSTPRRRWWLVSRGPSQPLNRARSAQVRSGLMAVYT